MGRWMWGWEGWEGVGVCGGGTPCGPHRGWAGPADTAPAPLTDPLVSDVDLEAAGSRQPTAHRDTYEVGAVTTGTPPLPHPTDTTEAVRGRRPGVPGTVGGRAARPQIWGAGDTW